MKKLLAASSLLFCICAGLASGAQILTNGGFETGNFSGWTLATQTGSFPGSNFFVVTGTSTPQSSSSTVGAASGSFFAVSDSHGPGAHALIEQFTIPGPSSSVVLSFSLFVNSYSPTFVNPSGLDFTVQNNQFARVDILTSGASAFDTGSGVLHNYYLGADAGLNPHAYTNYSFDVTSLVGAGGTFQIRFAEVDNLNTLNMGVDNVAINVTPLTTSPEPSSILISAAGLIGLAGLLSRRLPNSKSSC
jgi:hypothetical protein